MSYENYFFSVGRDVGGDGEDPMVVAVGFAELLGDNPVVAVVDLDANRAPGVTDRQTFGQLAVLFS